MKLYLIRHGETEGNRERRYLGWEDPPLTPAGIEQASALARRLAPLPLSAVCSSDLRRAAFTAVTIGAPHGLVPQTDPRLREANFGRFSGLTYEQIAVRAPERLRAWLADPERVAPPGGETLAEIRRRALAALPRMDGAVVVIHGGVIRTLLAHWTGRSFWEVPAPLASVTALEWDGERLLSLDLLGDTVHLEGERNACS